MDSAIENAVDHLFRHQAGQMVAVLTRIFGFERLDQIEDAVQEAMIRALRSWPYRGLPERPTAWLIQAAKNQLLDQLRRESRRGAPEEDALERACAGLADDATVGDARFARELRDDQLRLVFLCCHPVNSEDSQVALTLKTVGGFSCAEIARAFLAEESTITKRLVRAKKRWREQGVRLEMPPPDELGSRLAAVQQVVYLLFNEGYSALEGEDLVRTDLCFEAIRLAELLAEHPATATPKTDALAALLCLQAARLEARADAAGDLLRLEEQDRSRWSRGLVARGLEHFRRSAAGNELTDFHLEAEIAACHAVASRFEDTDWPRVLAAYEALLERKPSPVVALNRLVALAQVQGAEAALAELEPLSQRRELSRYSPLHAVRGELLRRVGRTGEAVTAFRRALETTSSQPVRRFLERRISETAG